MARMVRTVAAVMAAWAMLALALALALAPATAAPGDIFKTNAKATIDIGVDGGVEAVQISGVPAARDAWVAQVLSPEAGPAERVMDVNDQSSRFVLLNPPELPWM